MARRQPATVTPPAVLLDPPKGGAAVRMYRIGHGDCFLLAFCGKYKPVHVLIDCGYKPGSPGKITPPTAPGDVAADIMATTNGKLDVTVLTHEHQDHVNNISDKTFPKVKIGQTWLAWTDDPDDNLAEQLRKRYRDQLFGLLAAHSHLAAAAGDQRRARLAEFLAFELGGTEPSINSDSAKTLLATDGANSLNKLSMKHFKDNSDKVRYLRPGARFPLAGAENVTVYVLGPPRDMERLKDLDPEGAEKFDEPKSLLVSPINYLTDVLRNSDQPKRPFAGKYGFDWDKAFSDKEVGAFFRAYYGRSKSAPSRAVDGNVSGVSDNASWRRIDNDWLYSAEQLAIDMNDETNNASLVLAFELGQGGKVLLFAADAQAGNWRSWSDHYWTDTDGRKVDARDLLGRTVLYKVGHHGSHNATLKGSPDSATPCLGWMATQNGYHEEFTAMITAVPAWAQTQKGWNHPMPAIKAALGLKAAGRVLQTDTPIEDMQSPEKTEPNFGGRLTGNNLFFDLRIMP